MFNLDFEEELSIPQIRKILEKCDSDYYNSGNSELSDQEYDQLVEKLRSISPSDQYFQKIGAKNLTNAWKITEHKIMMGSLNKCNTKDEYQKWCSNYSGQKIMTPKLDGMSIELIYRNGNFFKAVTRGDGITGQDITQNVQKMNFPKSIEFYSEIIYRGEIVISKDNFKKLNENSDKIYKSPRNAVSGIAQKFDGSGCEFFDIIVYDRFKKQITGEYAKYGKYEIDLETIEIEGFCVPPSFKDNITEEFEKWENELREKYDYDLDGMVIRLNSRKDFDEYGASGQNPNAAIAWKFKSVKKPTIFRGYRFDQGKSNRVTPVATFDPVNILGADCSNASVHNADIFNKLSLAIGDEILIERANDIIPQIHSIINKSKNSPEVLPETCQSCGEKLVINGAYLECENEICPSFEVGNLIKFAQTIGMEDISFSIIEKLYDNKLIKFPADFYSLTVKDFINLEGLGEKSGSKIVEQFNKKVVLDLPTFIAAININGIGKSIVEKIVNKGFDTLSKIMSSKVSELVSVQGVKDITAEKVLNGLAKKKIIIENLLKVVKIEERECVSDSLSGKSYVFTGAVNKLDKNGKNYKREYLQKIVCENGGTCPSSLSKGVTYLVQADPNSVSSKTQKAIKYGTEIISEKSFFDTLDKNGIFY